MKYLNESFTNFVDNLQLLLEQENPIIIDRLKDAISNKKKCNIYYKDIDNPNKKRS